MKYNIQEIDKETLLQNSLNFKIRLYITDRNKNILDEVSGVIGGGSSAIDSDSDIRRTFSVTVKLDGLTDGIEDRITGWLGYHFNLQVGIYSLRTQEYLYYPCGYFTITESSTVYDAVTNTLTLNLSDLMAELNGARNGQIGGAPTILIPVENEDGTKNIIRDVLTGIVTQQGGIPDHIIGDIGAYNGLPEYNSDYENYRSEHPDWNVLPYDLTFNVGATVLEMINKIRDLYPNYQTYIDVYRNFCCDMIPSSKQDPILLSDRYLRQILVSEGSENVSYDISSIKNVTEVFGQTYDIDRMADICQTADNTYRMSLPDYEKYINSDYIAFKPDSDNTDSMYARINDLEALPIYDEVTGTFIPADTMLAGKVYVLQYKKRDGDNQCFYFLGQTQPHAVCALTGNAEDPVYTQDYFRSRYNCENIHLREISESPFTVQRLGPILEVKTGDNFDNIKSDSVALENAKYYNAKSAIMTDTVTITTKCIPFLDVQQKVEYRKSNENQAQIYVVKAITNDYDSGTSSITLHRFYPLYD